MAEFNTDVVVHVYSTVARRQIGSDSIYYDIEHPGSNKKIEGWKWDQRDWPTTQEFDAAALAPSIWDPNVSGVDVDQYQSGFGDNKDILLVDVREIQLSGENTWAPEINHGFFYNRDEEWYLFSDDYVTEYFTYTGLQDGNQYLQLSHDYKPTIPIFVRRYEYDSLLGRHILDLDFRKRVEIDALNGEPQFEIDTSLTPPAIKLNGVFSDVIGLPITTTVSGEANPSDIAQLEVVGISDGQAGQEFRLKYSPVDPAGDVEVWTWTDATFPTQYTIIDTLSGFSTGDIPEVKLDRDLGVVQFGSFVDGSGNGRVPAISERIGLYYRTGVSVQYEPLNTRDYALGLRDSANVNPVASSASQGFVQLSTESVDPGSVSLTSLLPQENPFIIQLGNNIGEVIATVRSAAGQLLEGQEVTFEILAPQVGTFGASSTTATAITDANGEARAFYNSPATVQNLGRPTVDIVHDGFDTVIDVDGLVNPGTVSSLFLYKIHQFDEVLGLPASGEDQYYTDYLAMIDAVSGVQATKEFEQDYRTINDLGIPLFYDPSQIEVGKKTIILTQKPTGVVDPHTGEYSTTAFAPLYPTTILDTGTAAAPQLRLTYQNQLLDLPGDNDTKAYFAIGDAQTSIRAFVTNQRTNRNIFSNTIQLKVTVPETVNGTFFAGVLNDVPSGLLTRTNNVDLLSDSSIETTSGLDSYYRAWLDEREIVSYPSNPDHFIRVRAKKNESAGDTVNVRVQIKESASVLAERVFENLDSEYITFTAKLTQSEVDSLVNYGDLSLTLLGQEDGLGTDRDIDVSWAALDISPASGISFQRLQPVADVVSGHWTVGPSYKTISVVNEQTYLNYFNITSFSIPLSFVPTTGNVLVLTGHSGGDNTPVTEHKIDTVTQTNVTWTKQIQTITAASARTNVEIWTGEITGAPGATIDIVLDTDNIGIDMGLSVLELENVDAVLPSAPQLDSGAASTAFPALIGASFNNTGQPENSFLVIAATRRIQDGPPTDLDGMTQLHTQTFFGDAGFDATQWVFTESITDSPAPATINKSVSWAGFGAKGWAGLLFRAELEVPSANLYTEIAGLNPDDGTFIRGDADVISEGEFALTSGIETRNSGEFESYVDWFRRTRRGDTVGLTIASLAPPQGVEDATLSGIFDVQFMDAPAEIPLGFRLKSTGITIASVLDQVTFLDPNDNLPDDYFDI